MVPRAEINRSAFPRLRKMNDALTITPGDMAGPVLVRLGELHRKQQLRIFATSGAAGATGRWAALHKGYAERKRAKFGRKKILQLTGAMKTRFTSANNPFYVQRYLGSSAHRGTFQFGARSSVAAAHRKGNPALAGAAPKGSKARTIFGGIAKRLPVRDMVSKTLAQRDEFQRRLETWYRKERVPQVLRANAALLRNSKPGRS